MITYRNVKLNLITFLLSFLLFQAYSAPTNAEMLALQVDTKELLTICNLLTKNRQTRTKLLDCYSEISEKYSADAYVRLLRGMIKEFTLRMKETVYSSQYSKCKALEALEQVQRLPVHSQLLTALNQLFKRRQIDEVVGSSQFPSPPANALQNIKDISTIYKQVIAEQMSLIRSIVPDFKTESQMKNITMQVDDALQCHSHMLSNVSLCMRYYTILLAPETEALWQRQASAKLVQISNKLNQHNTKHDTHYESDCQQVIAEILKLPLDSETKQKYIKQQTELMIKYIELQDARSANFLQLPETCTTLEEHLHHYATYNSQYALIEQQNLQHTVELIELGIAMTSENCNLVDLLVLRKAHWAVSEDLQTAKEQLCALHCKGKYSDIYILKGVAR